MIHHEATPPNEVKAAAAAESAKNVASPTTPSSHAPSDSHDLRELLEKNLKWSQIIYEQNRRINNKLLWSALANWFRLLVLVVPFILAAVYLPRFVENIKERYDKLLMIGGGKNMPNISVEELLKMLPLNKSVQTPTAK